MTVDEAARFFRNVPSISDKLNALLDVGLGYLRLGQAGTTLSGGEAQRVKLATELAKKATGRTVYILDEPTTGLHFADIEKLLQVLMKLRDAGNTLVVIEHNLEMIKCADWIVDLGPEGGRARRRDCGGGPAGGNCRSRPEVIRADICGHCWKRNENDRHPDFVDLVLANRPGRIFGLIWIRRRGRWSTAFRKLRSCVCEDCSLPNFPMRIGAQQRRNWPRRCSRRISPATRCCCSMTRACAKLLPENIYGRKRWRIWVGPRKRFLFTSKSRLTNILRFAPTPFLERQKCCARSSGWTRPDRSIRH